MLLGGKRIRGNFEMCWRLLGLFFMGATRLLRHQPTVINITYQNVNGMS
jgi:hypothetical protein